MEFNYKNKFMKIPLGKPYIKTEIALEAIKEVLDSRWISGGPRIAEFENKIKFFSNEANLDSLILKNNTHKYFSDVDKYANFKKNITNIILNLNEKIY